MTDPWARFTPASPAGPGSDPWARFTPATPTSATATPAQSAPPNAALDFVESIPVGVAKTAAQAAGLPRDAMGLVTGPMTDAVLKAGNTVRGWLGLDPITPTPEQRQAVVDVGRAMTPNLGVDGAVGAQRLAEGVTGPWHEPQTRAGKYGETIGSFLVPGALPTKATTAAPTAAKFLKGYLADLAGNVVVPALASETAGQATAGTKLEPIARLAGAVAGNMGSAYVRGASAPDNVLRRATGDMTDAQWQAARELAANPQGIKLTGPEAISQATGGASALPNVQRVVEGSVEGRARTAPFFAQRPGQVDAAVGSFLDRIAPQSPTPSVLGPRASDAATRALRDVEEARTAAVNPLYTAANADRVAPDVVNGLIGNIDRQLAADSTGILSGPLGELRSRLIETPARPGAPATRTPVMGPNGQVIRYEATPAVDPTPHVPITDIENLDRTRKYFRDRLALPQVGADAITREQAGAISSILEPLDTAMEQASAKFAAGKQRYADITRNTVQPIAEGPVGRVAAASDTPSAGAALLPQNPMTGSGPETADAVARLIGHDPETTRGLVRQNLADRYARAATDTQQGSREYAGAKFRNDVAGNDARREVLDAVLNGIPGGPAADAAVLLDALQATGRRMPIGSATEFNRTLNAELADGSLTSRAGLGLRSLGTSLITQAADAAQRAALRKGVSTLADMFVNPNSVDLIRAAAARGAPINYAEAAGRSGAQLAPFFVGR
ncbi:hypothetical protein SLNSH_02770 [Alsobacter soli]|uniref:Uncharacterized protein n=1 Tax=Alsobacter soli TaxID=2109933 RepID=A0A2T1HYG4_9HYPH|nr:hypothetical protein [Alsobacter soli]PSC06736.1 hypothetical protein SLNSH_02770 [Alsobacter soli]